MGRENSSLIRQLLTADTKRGQKLQKQFHAFLMFDSATVVGGCMSNKNIKCEHEWLCIVLIAISEAAASVGFC